MHNYSLIFIKHACILRFFIISNIVLSIPPIIVTVTGVSISDIPELVKAFTNIKVITIILSLVLIELIFWLLAELAIKYRIEANLFLFLASQEARREQRANEN